jgi:multidrug efflux system outer membrane protein
MRPAIRPWTGLVLGFAFAAAGCAVGPHYRSPVEPPVATTAASAAVADSLTTTPPPTAWWRISHDPILDGLITRALGANLDVRQALARVRQSRALFNDARLDLFPRVTSDAAYSRSDEQTPGFTANRTTIEAADLDFDATWEIDLFGRVRHSVEAARAGEGASQEDLAAARVTVAAEVARNYFIMRGAQTRRVVALANAETQAETLRLTRVRVDVGQGDPVDVQSARARLEATRSTIPAFTTTEAQAQYRLAVLIGERPGALDGQLAPIAAAPMARTLAVGDVSDFLRHRPDVRAGERRLAAQTARVGAATADLFPRVRLSGFIGLLSGDVSTLFKSGSEAWAVSPSLTWPAFDLGGARARLRAQKAEGEVSLAAYQESVLGAIEDLQDAVVAYGQRQRQMVSLAQQVDASPQAAVLAKLRYKAGDIDFLRVLDAERARLEAEDAMSAAETLSNTDMVAVYKALGGAA